MNLVSFQRKQKILQEQIERERKRKERDDFVKVVSSYKNRRDFILMMGLCQYETILNLSEKEVERLYKIAYDKMKWEIYLNFRF